MLHALNRRRALSDEALARATALVTESPPAADWRRVALMMALGVGALNLAGAFGTLVVQNWMHLGAAGQIGLAVAVFVLPGLLAFRVGVDRLGGQLAASASAGLVGPLLIVVESHVSDGGDWWMLFACWAALTLPFVWAARFAPLVLGALFVLDCTWLAFYGEVETLFDDWPAMAAAFGITAVHLVALAIWEAIHGPRPWMHGRWAPRSVGSTAIVALVVAAVPAMWGNADAAGIAALALLVVLTPVLQVVYWRTGRDLLLAAAPLIAGIFLFANLAGRFLIDTLDSTLGILVGVPIVGLMVVVATVLSLSWLRLGMQRGGTE